LIGFWNISGFSHSIVYGRHDTGDVDVSRYDRVKKAAWISTNDLLPIFVAAAAVAFWIRQIGQVANQVHGRAAEMSSRGSLAGRPTAAAEALPGALQAPNQLPVALRAPAHTSPQIPHTINFV
jgi:hypothetical protein